MKCAQIALILLNFSACNPATSGETHGCRLANRCTQLELLKSVLYDALDSVENERACSELYSAVLPTTKIALLNLAAYSYL